MVCVIVPILFSIFAKALNVEHIGNFMADLEDLCPGNKAWGLNKREEWRLKEGEIHARTKCEPR